MPAGEYQVLNKQQSISSSTSTPHAASPTNDSSSQDIKSPSRTDQAPASERKRALLCGVTYSADPDPKNHLKGSVNDVKLIKKMLTDFGYPDECICVLIDQDDQEMKRNELITISTPTKENIVKYLKWLVEGSKSGDKLVFFFSGHCSRPHDSENMNTPNNIGSTQSTDHCYRPRDSENMDTQSTDHDHDLVCLVCTGKDNLIPNCYINSTIVRPLKEGVTLYAIVDSCFSGRILDLKYTYDQQRINKKIAHGITTEVLSSTSAEGCWIDNQSDDLSKAEKGTSGGLAICLSATNNRETAESNANSGGKEILGAMTFNLTEMVEKNPNVTYEDILKKMKELHDESCRNIERVTLETISEARRDYLESRKIEVPVLSSSDHLELKVSTRKFLL